MYTYRKRIATFIYDIRYQFTILNKKIDNLKYSEATRELLELLQNGKTETFDFLSSSFFPKVLKMTSDGFTNVQSVLILLKISFQMYVDKTEQKHIVS